MKSSPAEIHKALLQLEQTAPRLGAAASGHREEALHASTEERAWSPAEILAHLRACADLWTHSIYAMLAAEAPELPDIDERKWARVTKYASLPFALSLEAFTLQRNVLLPVLRALPPAGWERDAVIFGRRHTVFTQARRLARHEAEHCDQLEALLRQS
jgi:hypothetical protein